MVCVVFFLFPNYNSCFCLDTFGNSISQWVDIDAELMLFIFLPPLIFGEAMSLNWYHLKGGFMQSVILAGPGVLIGAVLMGVFTKLLLPYDWNWNLAMTFGSILSATDPVAVVSLLKSVGASPKLTILIVGESLLNDGSAMVLFTIFFNALNGKTYTAGGIIGFSLAAAIGSVLLGIAFGFITVRWLRSANRPLKESDVTTQIAITICSAYLTFFVAQYSLGISGVLACCGAGAMLSWLAPPIILNHESMHNVWGIIEWGLNTLIFLLAGLIIGHRVIKTVSGMDWLYMIILYAILMAIRAVTIILLFPFISGIGHRCTKNEAVFMSWAGLRGALGMALALIVENNGPDDLDDQTKRLFFYVGGIAAITLIVNATTSKSLLYSLGLLTTNSAEKLIVTNQIKKKLRKKMNKVVQQMTKEFSFTEKDLEEVRLTCSLLQEDGFVAHYDDTIRMSALLAENIEHSQEREPLVYNREVLRDASSPEDVPSMRSATAAVQLPATSQDGPRQYSNRPSRVISKAGGDRDRSYRLKSRAISGILSPTSHHQQIAVSNSLRVRRMSRLLSRGGGGGGMNRNLIDRELLTYIRCIFLEIVRVKYWHFIEIGKLPRLSFSAQFLLYTVEVGLDETTTIKEEKDIGMYSKDWNCLEKELSSNSYAIDSLSFMEKTLPACCADRFITNFLSFLETRKEKREVYMITSFIEAHEHAQTKIHKFLGVDGEEDEDEEDEDEEGSDKKHPGGDSEKATKKSQPSSLASTPRHQMVPEEIKVIEESRKAVNVITSLLLSFFYLHFVGCKSKSFLRIYG
jgi:NhaP-type Na+/H+ or K+/H+ antiporter